MGIERVTHYVDNLLTQAEARMGLRNTKLLVAWYTNQKTISPWSIPTPTMSWCCPSAAAPCVTPSTAVFIWCMSASSSTSLLRSTTPASSILITTTLTVWSSRSTRPLQACRRNANLKNAAWMHSITVLDPDVCNKWDFQSLFVRMAQSQELPAQMRDIVFEAQVSEMMLLITLATGSGQTTAPSSTNVLVQRAVSYLQAHYQDPTLTTVKLAQELYASREHLSRAFKECTMESIHSYLTHLRMQHCRKALEDGVSVLNACTESGFPDYSSFLKTFRRLYGITPAEYRSQNRKKV